MDNFFAIAQWEAEPFHLMEKIITGDIIEVGNNVNYVKPKSVTQFRQLTNKLSREEKAMLLNEVIHGKTTLVEMGNKALKMRQVKKVQKFLMLDLGYLETDWASVEMEYPRFTTARALDQWINVASKLKDKANKRPPGWEAWIQTAKQYRKGLRAQLEVDADNVSRFMDSGCNYIFHWNTTDTCFALLGKPQPGNYGISLFFENFSFLFWFCFSFGEKKRFFKFQHFMIFFF